MGKQSTRSSSQKQSPKKTTTTTTTTKDTTKSTGNVSKTVTAAVTSTTETIRSSKRKNTVEGGGGEMFSKKKKNALSSSTTASSYDVDMTTANSPEAKIMEMFKTISEDPDDPNAPATMEGISILGEHIGMDAAEDVRILILLWKLGVGKSTTSETPTNTSSSSSSHRHSGSGKAKSSTNNNTMSVLNVNFVPGTIQPLEWKHGCLHLDVDSWESIEGLKPQLDIGFLDHGEFRDFYKFCFRFNLSGTHRTLDSETVIALLHMILDDSHRINDERLNTFCTFLQEPEKGKPYQRITLDQWMSFLDFCNEIPNNSELISSSNKYDESTSAWPVLIDEYVEYIQKS